MATESVDDEQPDEQIDEILTRLYLDGQDLGDEPDDACKMYVAEAKAALQAYIAQNTKEAEIRARIDELERLMGNPDEVIWYEGRHLGDFGNGLAHYRERINRRLAELPAQKRKDGAG